MQPQPPPGPPHSSVFPALADPLTSAPSANAGHPSDSSPADGSVLVKDAQKWLNLAHFLDVLLTPRKLRPCVFSVLSGGWAGSLQGSRLPVFSSGQISKLITQDTKLLFLQASTKVPNDSHGST